MKMYKDVSNLLMYGEENNDSILYKIGEIFEEFESGEYNPIQLKKKINITIKMLLETATKYGFDGNLWNDYLTFYLMMSENPFTITCEKTKVQEGTVNEIVKNDYKIFKKLFEYDFTDIEEKLNLNIFSLICNYKSFAKKELSYNKNVSERIKEYSGRLKESKDENEFYNVITEFYIKYGVGMLGLNKAFRLKAKSNESDAVELVPINNLDNVVLDDLIGYEIQKKKLVDNTEAFLQGKKANNVLLYGDSGTGKSTSIKAIINQYYDQGLRMIEIYKHQFKYLSEIIESVKKRNYKFIIYMDDLSFEEFEIEYKFLKAVIEGGVETKPENILIYATSNRRHLIKETWNDRNDADNSLGKHRSDTVEEKLSLVNRFGVTIGYTKPTPKEFMTMVVELARRQNIKLDEQTIKSEANKWEIAHGGISGRTAQQFINYLESQI
nr:ATP-binding protein [Lachnobacterium bovis]